MNRHLLFIAFWYPPARASGVYRALSISERFRKQGWDVTVITTSVDFLEDEVGSVDPSLMAHIPEGVEVVRVPFSLSIGDRLDVGGLGWLAANFPTTAAALARRFPNWVGKWLTAFRTRGIEFSDNYTDWIDPVVERGIAVDLAGQVTHVLATGNPYSSFEAARLIAGEIGVGYSIDYRDPWTIDVFTGAMDATDSATEEAELRIVEQSDLCFHVNEQIAGAYRARYPKDPSKHRTVPNGFDPASIPAPSGPATGPIRFGVLGTFNERWPVDELFKGWVHASPGLPDGSELILAGHLGYFEKSKAVMAARFPSESEQVRYMGPVAKEDVADFYAGLDVLVLPVPGGKMVTSGKVYEAMAMGKAFVCVQDEDGGARQLVTDHPLAIGSDPNANAIARALNEAADMARNLEEATSREIQERAIVFERGRAVDEMVRDVTAVVTGASA